MNILDANHVVPSFTASFWLSETDPLVDANSSKTIDIRADPVPADKDEPAKIIAEFN